MPEPVPALMGQNPQSASAVPSAGTPAATLNDAVGLEHPLRPLITVWLEKIKLAWQVKEDQFGKDAQECMRFYRGPYNFLYRREYMLTSAHFSMSEEAQEIPSPTFQMTTNRVAELVQLFGPVLYHQNPDRLVNPREIPIVPGVMALLSPNDPSAQMMEQQIQQQEQQQRQLDDARAQILQWYLNYTPTELGLEEESRQSVDEALIKGGACMWTELYQPKGTNIRLVGTFWRTVDNLVIDPDMESLKDAKWIAEKCIHPVWDVEKEYGLPKGSLKPNLESYNQQATTNADIDGDYHRKRGITNDLLVYWKIYSKMGLGSRMAGAQPELKEALDQFGDFCFLVIAEGTPYPLNLPPEAQKAVGATAEATKAAVQKRLDWPTPYWLDDAWPVELIHFHDCPRMVWPVSHIKFGLGELKFLNWAYSFIASKIRISCRDFLAIKKMAGEELTERILHGKDYELISIEEAHGTISEVVAFLQHPPMNRDIFEVLMHIEKQFERRTGLNELIYGESAKQMRSAEEANLKQSQLQVRPDDMAKRLEKHMSNIARKEAIAARWHLHGQDVAPIMGPAGALYWDRLVRTADPYALAHQMEYRIEAGSIRKPNQERNQANMAQAMQTLFQPLMELAVQHGVSDPVNALITDWAKSIQLKADKYLIQLPPPGPSPEQQKVQMQQQLTQQQMQGKQQEIQLQTQGKLAEIAMRGQEHEQRLAMEGQQHEQAMAHQDQQNQLERQAAAHDHILQMSIASHKAAMDKKHAEEKLKQQKAAAAIKPKVKPKAA